VPKEVTKNMDQIQNVVVLNTFVCHFR
jgi:hypothetical protein